MQPDYIIWKITETEEELRSQLLHPEYFADKVVNLKPGSKRLLEILAVRRAMKELFYGEEREVLYTPEGAPYLAEGPYISISHTMGYVAVITDQRPVSIDIERRGTKVQRVVSQFLKSEELCILQLAADGDADAAISSRYSLALHLAWSAKEVAYKLLGHDYYDLKQLTSVRHIDWQNRLLVLGVEGRELPLPIHFDFTDDYVLCWAE